MQLTFPEGTGPPVVGGLKLHDAVSTTVPGGCWTVTIAVKKARSVMVSVQLVFGHPGAPGIGFVGAEVVTLNATFPFLTSLAGMAWLPGLGLLRARVATYSSRLRRCGYCNVHVAEP